MSKQEQENFNRQVAEDEIDLVQLFRILLRRKYLILCVTLLCLIVGTGYALLKKQKYNYTTTLQIGTAIIEGKDTIEPKEIESPSSARLKIEKVYIPVAIEQLRAQYENRLSSVSVKEQKNSNIILISSKGAFEDRQFATDLHTMIVAPLIVDHRGIISSSKKQYEILVERAKLILKDLEDPRLFEIKEKALKRKIESSLMELGRFDDQKKLLLANKAGLEEMKKLLNNQISQIQENLKLSYAKRLKAASEASDETKAMAFLMLNNDILQSENRLAILRERLYVNLENDKQKIESQFAETQRARKSHFTNIEELKSQLTQIQAQLLSEQEQQENVISAAENKIHLYRDTRALEFAVRSLRPDGPGKSLILALAGLLGLMGGVLLAFIAEFMVKVKSQQEANG